MVDPMQSLSSKLPDADFDRAFELLQSLVDLQEANHLFQQRAHTVYTACVVLWMLVYQRLKPDASLENAVKHLLKTRPDYLPDNKRIQAGTLSSSTVSNSVARNCLTLEVAQWFSREVSDGIIATTEPAFEDRRVFVVDGTTISLAAEKELQQAFPPASNHLSWGNRPIALLNVFHDLSSGCAILPEVWPMYGTEAVSETLLACRGFENLPASSIIMGDAGYGIFGVPWSARRCGHDYLFRMKKSNFHSLAKTAELVEQSEHHKSFRCDWKPTKMNRQANPELPDDASLEVFLHEVEVTETLTLYLVTNLSCDGWTLSSLFERRYDVEIDIRNFKVVLDAENIRAKSVDMFLKELYASVVAYNLSSQFRREAAKLAKLPARRLSFNRVWTTFRTFLLEHLHTEATTWRAAFAQAMSFAVKDKLPNRAGRNVKREAYRKRPKDAQFETRKKPPSKLEDSDPK